MFTGIVQDIGSVRGCELRGGDLRLDIGINRLDLSRLKPGDSVAVAGVCLTIVALQAGGFATDVSRETLALTTMGDLRVGQPVNLEPALRAGDSLGGHLLSGHVDGIATLLGRGGDGRSERMRVQAPAALARFIARKGSVALDGVSLTVNEIDGDVFDINLVPHTLAMTTLDTLQPGSHLNIEIDQLARYVERLLESAASPWTG